MDSTLTLLKQEINKTMEAEHDLAKWKLGVTAALGAAAFGFGQNGSSPSYWLLLFVPFVCAYVDLFNYQYELRIRVIARFLRKPGQGDELLQKYEQECDDQRGKRIFSLGNWAEFGCSLGASILGPIFYVLHNKYYNSDKGSLLVSRPAAGIIWFLGVLLIVFLWLYFQYQALKLSGDDDSRQTAAAA
jgi:hypothetical protein